MEFDLPYTMKPSSSILLGLVFLAGVTGAKEFPPALLYDPPDGSEPVPRQIRAAFKPAEVIDTKVTSQGGRKVIVQRLALDPAHPVTPVRKKEAAPPPSGKPQENTAPEVAPPFHLLMLSATVYPGPATRLEWTWQKKDGSVENVTGWSNIDFNHFTGVSSFLATDGEEHSFNMGIGTEEGAAEGVPKFRTSIPGFIPTRENVSPEALLTVDSLHKLYAIEKDRLAAAHEGSKLTAAARRAELKANPSKPKDLIIRYRVAQTSSPLKGGAK